ncbi:exported hypothetical protein [uncultured Pleomorphomonas sp.]|uniref:Uncharacterized protein n=1 Tax=uncultured Pleomorphomonas sp. TaxID=442121 RepID=A0A212LQG3_9HYPH|nr:hypothetical protein [uncultured Pleomorphomonas sp.]SCM79721.1 exported hypothetical protein [uncultured Pleomorphomonas sp.]
MCWSFTAPKFQAAVMAASFLVFPNSALADSAIHKLTMVAETIKNTDCSGGSCVPSCKIEASLSTMPNGPTSTPELNVLFQYKTDHVDTGEAAISLQFAELKRGGPGTATAWASGYACRDLKITRAEIECLNNPNGKCSDFYKVLIPAVPDLHLSTISIEAK